MAETIICPYSWGRTIIRTGDGGQNYLKLGYDADYMGGEFRMVMKFDFSPLTMVAPSRIQSIGLKMYITSIINVTTMNSISHEVLKAATSGVTWNTYNGSSAWTTPGAGASGSDYYQVQLGTRLWASIGYSTMQINPETFKLMWANNHAMVMRAAAGPEPYIDPAQFVNFSSTDYKPYLEVTIRAGSSYVIIF